MQSKADPTKLVFIDESGVNTNMTPRYGRAIGSERVIDHAPLNKGKTTTIVSSIRVDGSTVPMTIEGAMNGERFKEYVEKHLCPALRQDDVVIMDNLSFHKVDGIKEAIEQVGAHLWYLPPYSPDLNPIELMWSKVKAYLRKVKARSALALCKAIPVALAAVTKEDVVGWFREAGYGDSES